ncbi:hypothetical protein [Asticcacaulis machinosus]|uniref:Peptidase propeptide and YPEB domain-containing protein n=1 Tax=Asticcacaulis machinosus TaxID=2984211 RepID=A0ABT5HML4_9CAUL|nr:hypothetical protein [Asticcacaulis machinosus]MDC7677258.1 hypothetical protein [Asticcacaulis machinosus]
MSRSDKVQVFGGINDAMKQAVTILCAVLAIGLPSAGQAQSVRLEVSAAAPFLLAQNNDRRDRDRGRDERSRDNKDNEPRRDDRLNRAIAIAQSRGRVLDAGPEKGAIFWVRVATERGRVDFLVDTNSGRIVGER